MHSRCTLLSAAKSMATELGDMPCISCQMSHSSNIFDSLTLSRVTLGDFDYGEIEDTHLYAGMVSTDELLLRMISDYHVFGVPGNITDYVTGTTATTHTATR
jgi:hypothetical protein